MMQIETLLVEVGLKIWHFGVSANSLLATNVIGLFLSVIEIIVESVSIKRQVEFLSEFHLNSLEKIDQFISEKDPQKKKELLIKCCHNLCYSKNVPISKKLKETLSTLEINLLFSDQVNESALLLAKQAMTEASEQILKSEAESVYKKYREISPDETLNIRSIAKARFPSATPSQLLLEKMTMQKELLIVKSNNLARRVSPWCAKEISSKIKPLLEQMKSEDPIVKENACKQIKDLLFTAKIQAKKYLYYHIVSLAVFTLSAISMIALLASCPPLIPTLVIGAVGTISFASYIAHIGTIEQKGWKFSASDCIPTFVKNGYAKVCKFYRDCIKAKKPSIIDGPLNKTCRVLNGPGALPRHLSYCR